MGSTSYDEARDASDPRWAGASWYGPTTGEYWIVNPREYADPRKHGPGYSSRGRTGPPPRRPVDAAETPEPEHREREWPPKAGAASDSVPPQAARPEREPPSVDANDAGSPASGPAAWTTAAASGAETAARAARTSEVVDIGAWVKALTTSGPSDPTHRFGIALLAWAPVGIAVAAVINGLTGCATYTLACDGTDQLLPWLAQAAIVGLLLLVPAIARVFAAGTIGMLVGLVPGVAILIAFGGAHTSAAGALLALLAVIAWVAGVAWAIRVMLRAG